MNVGAESSLVRGIVNVSGQTLGFTEKGNLPEKLFFSEGGRPAPYLPYLLNTPSLRHAQCMIAWDNSRVGGDVISSIKVLISF